MAAFAVKWFTVYYLVFGLFLVIAGALLIMRPKRMRKRLLPLEGSEKPPALLKNVLRYILLFTLPNVVLAFFPFSWVELLAAFCMLILVYLLGSILLRWPQIKVMLHEYRDQLGRYLRTAGATLLALGLAMLSLGFRMIELHVS